MSRTRTLGNEFRRLSKVDKVFLIAFALRLTYFLLGFVITPLPVAGLVSLFFVIACVIFLVRSFPRMFRSVLWRVRHRLIVTWILIGVVPIVLICALVAEGFYMLMGQAVGYMTSTEILRRSDAIRDDAQFLAWSLAHRSPSVSATTLTETFVAELSERKKIQASSVVRMADREFAVPANAAIRQIPDWSRPNFLGLIKGDGGYYIGSDVVTGESAAKVEVFLYQTAPREFFSNLLADVATIVPEQGSARAGGIDIRRTDEGRRGFSINTSRTTGRTDNPDPQLAGAKPPGTPRGPWDIDVTWAVLTPSTDLVSGTTDESLALVASRPSLILNRLFSTLGNTVSNVVAVLLIATAVGLLIVEIAAVIFGVKLTRSITRSVSDLYLGTKRIQTGDFSHRIPIRTQDQLSELAGSFNTMTERIEGLIIEVKEKERLENELEIARDVQTQLFPKELPRLKTLEVFGICDPARTVSGDYYDFLTVDSNRIALAIGDISGKGISAALLMAHIQSALRSQLMHRETGAPNLVAGREISPSGVLSILNDHLYASSPPEKYATFFLGLYGDQDGHFIYTNAGHLAPLLIRRGEVTRLPGDGLPVGMFPGAQYEQRAVGLEPGDLLVGFTDGVTETPNPDGEEFGDHRLTELLIQHRNKPLEGIANEIRASLSVWSRNAERYDDTTLILAKRLE